MSNISPKKSDDCSMLGLSRTQALGFRRASPGLEQML